MKLVPCVTDIVLNPLNVSEERVRLPLILPPEEMVALPAVPVPAKVAPESTETEPETLSEPGLLTARVPALTVVMPV